MNLLLNIFYRYTAFITAFVALSATFLHADSLRFKAMIYELRLQDGKSVEINISNCVPVTQRRNPEAVPSDLHVEYSLIVKMNEGNETTHKGELSHREELLIENYDYQKGLSLFGGQMKSEIGKDEWKVSFYEAISRKQIAIVSMTEIEYSMLIKAIQKSMIIENAFRDNWKSIADVWQKTHIMVDKTEVNK